MAYSGVFVFGDSLVDAGNALKLAEWYGDLTFSDLPDGAPSAERGYFKGRFSDGYTFADLLSNKLIGAMTKPVFPYGYEDPWLDLLIAPWAGDPSGNNLNFAYGGAQIKRGDEVVSDLDAQTDAFRDAVDGEADPNALYLVATGGNDVRSLAPEADDPTPAAEAYAILDDRAALMLHELSQLVTMDGVRNILITGMADVGIVARYDLNGDNKLGPDIDLDGDGILDAGEATRAAAATDYSRYLDHLIRTVVIPGLEELGAIVTYVPLMDYVDETTGVPVTGALTANLETIAALNGVTPDGLGETAGQHLAQNLLFYDKLLFFDALHPNAQANALLGSFMLAELTGTPWVETLPLLGSAVQLSSTGTIGAAGEVDAVTIALASNSTYTFQMLGVSSLTSFVAGQLGFASLPTSSLLGDPSLRLLSSNGVVRAADDDSGAGFDSSLTYKVTNGGTYTLQLSAVGSVTGNYAWTVSATGAAKEGNSYVVSNAATLVIEDPSWNGVDTVSAVGSYALFAGSGVEVLQTTNRTGTGAINLTGNEFAQQIIGNDGANALVGLAGADTLLSGLGSDQLDGGDGNDILVFGRGLDPSDHAVGGAGTDTLVLQGDYSSGIDLGNGMAAVIGGIETLSLQSGSVTRWGDTANNLYSYRVTVGDTIVSAGEQFKVNGQSLRAGENLTFDGSAETGGKFLIYGGFGADTVTGGAGNDIVFFEAGRFGAGDKVNGGAGTDAVVISGGISPLTPLTLTISAGQLANIESLSFNGRFASDPAARPSYDVTLQSGNIAAGATLIVNGSSLGETQSLIFDGSAESNGRLTIYGGSGADRLKAGTGSDFIYAGGGADQLHGGGGADTFQYREWMESTATASDHLLDFASGSDKVDLQGIDAVAGSDGNQAFAFVGSAAFTGTAGQLRAEFNAGVWTIQGDVNGDGVADLQLFVHATALGAADFLL